MMIQRVNGTKLMVMVLQAPTYGAVSMAQRDGRAVVLETASYTGCMESTGRFELVDIRNIQGRPDSFQFSGTIAGVDTNADPDDETRSLVIVKSGAAKVVVDSGGADIEFVIDMTLCVM